MEKSASIYLSSGDGSFHLLGLGCTARFEPQSGKDLLMQWDQFLQQYPNDYRFCCLNYDLKNEIESLQSSNPDAIGFPLLLCWVPRVVWQWRDGEDPGLKHGKPHEVDWHELQQFMEMEHNNTALPNLEFEPGISREMYLDRIRRVKQHIQQGDVYELNYCQQYVANQVSVLPSMKVFRALRDLTRAPFSAYLNIDNFEVFCGSPERFLRVRDGRIESQPIKGTIRRGSNPEEDEILKKQLRNDPKERAENIMITDLVRNDLSRVATTNSVQVDELCGVYSFGTVHQMISTVSASLREGTTPGDIIRACFPMGSMTGAPKIRSMELIETLETFRRGLYSGSIGYLAPDGSMDLNVVIRSLIYNHETQTLSCAVGGAITIQSDPEKEYTECLTKVGRILNLFGYDPAQ